MSDSHDGCTESGLKVQSCDGALNELAAYKNAAYQENLRMEPYEY